MVEAEIKGKSDVSQLSRMRSRIDIMAAVLNETIENTRKTRIMYRCNLSHRQLKSYLKLLLSMGMLRSSRAKRESETELFVTTRKGKKFLSTYRELKTLMSSSSTR